MSLIGSLGSGVSAMKSFVKGIEVIGDNIANSKTAGYKRQRVNYSDNFSDTLRDATPGSTNSSNMPPVQIGSGVNVSAAQKLMTQGSIERTGVVSDLAISGKGFFRVLNTGSEEQFLTRDGSFRLDESGFLTDKNGNHLLGLTGGSSTEDPGVLGRMQVDLASDIRIDESGRPLDGSGRIVLTDGTRALANDDSATGHYRVDEEGRLLDAQTGNIILGDLDNNSTTTEFARYDEDTERFLIVNDAGNLIDEFGAEVGAFNPREKPPGGAAAPVSGQLFNAYNANEGATYQVNGDGNYVDSNGDDLGVPFDPTVAPEAVSPTSGDFNLYNRSDDTFYRVNAAGNYVDSTGIDLGEAFDPDTSPTVSAVPPAPGTVFNTYNEAEGEFYQVNAAGNYVDANGIDLGEAFEPTTSPTVSTVGPAAGETFAAWNENDATFYQLNAAGNYVDGRGINLRIEFDPQASPSFPGEQPASAVLNVFNRADGEFYRINQAGNYVDAAGTDLGEAYDATQSPTVAAVSPAAGTVFNAYNTNDGGFYRVNANGNYVDASGNLLPGVEWDPTGQPLASAGSTAALFAEYNANAPVAGTPSVAIPDANDPAQFKLAIQSWTINQDGELTLSLNDGTTYVRGQLMLQQVRDEDSLVEEGSGLYSGFTNAGSLGLAEWNLGSTVNEQDRGLHLPNQSGAGFIQSRALEGSNTDLTEEFSNMITTQRAFQAGSKLINVSDEILQEIVNLKR